MALPHAQSDPSQDTSLMPQFSSWQELDDIEPPYAGGDLKTCKQSL